jgi:hypothetical protein
MCEELNTEAWFFNYGAVNAKDVGGMSLDEIRSGIETAKHMVKGERVL